MMITWIKLRVWKNLLCIAIQRTTQFYNKKSALNRTARSAESVITWIKLRMWKNVLCIAIQRRTTLNLIIKIQHWTAPHQVRKVRKWWINLNKIRTTQPLDALSVTALFVFIVESKNFPARKSQNKITPPPFPIVRIFPLKDTDLILEPLFRDGIFLIA